MALGLGSIHHVAVLVEDLAGAEAFYGGTLGLHVERRWPDGKGGLRSVWLSLGNDALLMLERADEPREAAAGAKRAGWHLLALTIAASEREKVEAALARRGIPVESRTDYTIYFRDPEGNRIGLSHYPHPVPQRP